MMPSRSASTPRRMGAAIAICLLATLARPARAETFDVISKIQDTPAATVWRIEQPNVQRHQTSYPQIKLLPADTINVAAGGCVQTGGSGKTWKRYVDPSGDNSDHLYHGLIGVPGVTNGLVRLQQFGLGANHKIPSPLPSGVQPANLVLSLGYEDDNYSDNGYYSHDDGTEGQCTNSVNAFVVISISHAGAAPPPAASFVGITPDKFRCQAAWAFHNFDTPTLDWGTFSDAFNLGLGDYADPTTYVSYLFGRKLAAGGNCEGMSLLSIVGEDQFLVGDLQENFWQNYKDRTVQHPNVTRDINVAHWAQLSTFFMQHWVAGYFQSPAVAAAAIERDLTKSDYNYGLLSLAHGFGGHVLVPLRVSHAGNQTMIDVYDPNRECNSVPDPADYPKVVISNGNWSYQMAGSDGTWSGSDGLVYIPYYGQDGWSNLGTNVTGVVSIIFGAGVSINQVTDARGRHLFKANTRGEIDNSANGLGHALMRLPVYSQAKTATKRPRDGTARLSISHALPLTPEVQARQRELEEEYGADYAEGGTMTIATDPALGALTFDLSRTTTAHPVRAMVRQNGTFFEIRTEVPGTAEAGPQLTINDVKNLAAGVTMTSTLQQPLNVVFTQGTSAHSNQPAVVEKATPMTVVSTARASLVGGHLDLAAKGAAMNVTVTHRTVQPTGAVAQTSRSVATRVMQ